MEEDMISTSEADAEQIIEWCIEDIETTHWCKGKLAEVRHNGGEPKGMGCALGLLALNGGLTRRANRWEVGDGDGRKGETWDLAVDPRTVSKARIRPDLIRAIRAVALAAPPLGFSLKSSTSYLADMERSRAAVVREGIRKSLDTACDMIISFNDNSETTRERAVEWFRDALELLRKGGA